MVVGLWTLSQEEGATLDSGLLQLADCQFGADGRTKKVIPHAHARSIVAVSFSSAGDLRDWPVAMIPDAFQQTWRGDVLTEVVARVRGQSEVAVHERRE